MSRPSSGSGSAYNTFVGGGAYSSASSVNSSGGNNANPVSNPLNSSNISQSSATGTSEEHKYGIGLGLRLVPSVGYAVVSVCPSSSAERAGINVNDVLIAADGKTIQQGLKPLDILGVKHSVAVLDFENGKKVEVARAGPPLDNRGLRQDGLLGLSVSRIQGRVLVAHVAGNSPAQREGLQMGDCILTMNGVPCDPARLTSRGPVGSKVVLTVQRHGHPNVKTATLTRVAVGSGWKHHTRENEAEREERRSHRNSRWATYVSKSPSKDRTRPSSSLATNSGSGGTIPSSALNTRPDNVRIDNMYNTIEMMQNEITQLKARLTTYEHIDEQLAVLRTQIDIATSAASNAVAITNATSLAVNEKLSKKGDAVDSEDVTELKSEVNALKTKVEQNTAGVDEATTAIKMMNLGIHAAINGISHELDVIFDHCKVKRPPRNGPGDGAAPRPNGVGPSQPNPVAAGRARPRRPPNSSLAPLTEDYTLSPQSMKVHSSNPSAPGGLAVLGNIPRRPAAPKSSHEV